jgi:hypothetical protein
VIYETMGQTKTRPTLRIFTVKNQRQVTLLTATCQVGLYRVHPCRRLSSENRALRRAEWTIGIVWRVCGLASTVAVAGDGRVCVAMHGRAVEWVKRVTRALGARGVLHAWAARARTRRDWAGDLAR